MSERDIGLEILEGIQEIKAYKDGKLDLRTRVLTEPSTPKETRFGQNYICRRPHLPG
jgi:putative transcriptional regulator